MAKTVAPCQALWLRNLLSKVTRSELKLVTLYVDKKSVIALMKNLVFHGCSKHIDTCFDFIHKWLRRDKSLWTSYALENNVQIF